MAKLSIIACAHNEQDNIRPFWEKISGLVNDFELIFLNDGSTDGTLKEMQAIRDSRVKIINVLLNRGKNLVLPNLAFRDLNEIVVTTDVDLEDDLEALPKMIEIVKTGAADLVIGERQQRKSPLLKLVSSGIFNKLQRILFGLKMRDTNCGLKVFKRSAFQDCGRILKRKTQYRYIALICFLNGFAVKPFPIRHFHRRSGKSHYGIKRIFNGLFDLLYIFLFQKTFVFRKKGKGA